MPEDCPFCDVLDDQVIAREGPCFALWTGEPPEGSAMVLPIAHRGTPWDLTGDEWAATWTLLSTLRGKIAGTHTPDGWNVGWNVGEVGGQSVPHAHCHLIPRYAAEKYAGRGLRWWFKQPENSRPAR